jgi:outer membrane protein OmpA-like peptidoglycan-associated protein
MKKLLLIVFFTFSFTLGSLGQTLLVSCTIYFEHNSSQLTPKEQHKLDSFIQIVATRNITESTIDAWCNESGTQHFNLQLSEKRALRVQQYVAAHGADTSELILKPHGELKGSQTDSLSRKAVWRVHYVASSPQPTEKSIYPEKSLPPITDTLLEVGKTIVLKNINFEGGTANLLPQSVPALDELISLLQKNTSMKIEIGGHVCCFNDKPLSVLRAKRIYDIVVGNGIAASRLTYKGYSNTKPVALDSDETKRTKNRRVEIKILSL